VRALLDEARALLPDIVELRRAIHREPALGLDDLRTQARVLVALADLPPDVRPRARRRSSSRRSVLAGDDFACVLERVPGALASLGTRPSHQSGGPCARAHSNRYLLEEDAMVTGVATNAAAALEFLQRR
jgi:metal-dependent amidase/aminoacylase/carboxypeptidase family protein